MQFWQGGVILNLLLLATLLLVAAGLRRLIPWLTRWAVPDSVIAGGLGFVLGPSVLSALPVDQSLMELLAYHGLALTFIAVSLQTPDKSHKASGAVSFIYGIPVLAVVQAVIALFIVLGWSAVTGKAMHPGMGVLVPLGFSQGPGQALSMGTSWEAQGLEHGGQVGLILAAWGFAWCCIVGIPLVMLARRRGWLAPEATRGSGGALTSAEEGPRLPPPGGQEPLMLTMGAIAVVYLVTWGALLGLNGLLSSMPKQQATIWGFHFVLAGLLAMPLRGLLGKMTPEGKLHDGLLGRVAGLVVDFTTAGALAAIKLSVLKTFFWPIFVLATTAGLSTLWVSIWLARRAFPEAPFEHALVLYGTSTGTLPTGLTLLRILDPELRGPVATNTVIGSSAALVPGLPLLAVMMPYAINRWPEGFPGAVWTMILMMSGYMILLMVLWRYTGPLRMLRPWLALWPERGADGK